MPEITVAILDTFHPQIKAAIKAAVPTNWTVRFTAEKSLTARAVENAKSVLRGDELPVTDVVVAPNRKASAA